MSFKQFPISCYKPSACCFKFHHLRKCFTWRHTQLRKTNMVVDENLCHCKWIFVHWIKRTQCQMRSLEHQRFSDAIGLKEELTESSIAVTSLQHNNNSLRTKCDFYILTSFRVSAFIRTSKYIHIGICASSEAIVWCCAVLYIQHKRPNVYMDR